jgi:chromate reductase, NAD(P)H dehydrogenase (quinone)
MIQVLGISGSLRAKSLNTAAIKAAAKLVPPGMALELFPLHGIPLYDEDLNETGYPAPVQKLRDAIAQADAVLIATPEYNYSFSGVLKNAIDWASRPPSQPFGGKPIAILGASPGMLGTARAQYQLRQVFIFMNGKVLNRPEVFIAAADKKFDANGELSDEKTKEAIQKQLLALKAAVEECRKLQA